MPWLYLLPSVYVSSERIAAWIAQKLPYANIIGSDTEEQIEDNLDRPGFIAPPFLFQDTVEISGQNLTLQRPVGCFIRGAGIYVHTYSIYMKNHIYSTLFKIQERKSDRSRDIEQRKELQNTHTHIKQGHVTLIYCINIKSPSSLNGLEKYIFKYLIKHMYMCSCTCIYMCSDK